MNIFIISPLDESGRLYTPAPYLLEKSPLYRGVIGPQSQSDCDREENTSKFLSILGIESRFFNP
jgi:hypothetical protein